MKKLLLTCPDILYQTRSSVGRVGVDVKREAWQQLAKKFGVQGIILDWRPRLEQEFTCEDVDLKCDAQIQTSSYLVPWCCHGAFRHVLTILENLEMEYELFAGSALGAVKIGNFLPWDIDVDMKFSSNQFEAYKEGGVAHRVFTKGDVTLNRYC